MRNSQYLKPLTICFFLISSMAQADLSGLGGAAGTVDSTVGGVAPSVSGSSASATASADTSISGVADVGLCAEASVNSDSSGNCGAAPAATRGTQNPSRSGISSATLLGMPVIGASDKLVGRVKRVAMDQQHIKWILVEMGNKQQVQLSNAIRSVDSQGIKLGLTRSLIKSRTKGNFTRIRVQCDSQQGRLQNPRNLNSCWDGTS